MRSIDDERNHARRPYTPTIKAFILRTQKASYFSSFSWLALMNGRMALAALSNALMPSLPSRRQTGGKEEQREREMSPLHPHTPHRQKRPTVVNGAKQGI